MKKLTKRQIEIMAKEIRAFLLKYDMWIDTTIYFNGKAFSTDDRKGRFYYNDPEHLIVLENVDPKNYFDYVGPILSMSFEGDFYDVMNGYYGQYGIKIENEFHELLRKYGCYCELGNAWNLSLYYL